MIFDIFRKQLITSHFLLIQPNLIQSTIKCHLKANKKNQFYSLFILMKTLQQSKQFTPSPTKSHSNAQQNPQQLLTSQLSIDTRFDTQMIRIKVQHHTRLVETLFKLDESELSVAMMAYQTLPYSPIKVKQLIDSSSCKLIKSSNTKIYLGQTLNKKKHGRGVAIYNDGRIYQGTFADNQRTGPGVQLYSNGNIYFGHFHQNKKHGKGVFFWFSVSEIPCSKNAQVVIEHYKGSWWGGLPDGKGQHYRSNGDVYVGEFKNGLKHGKGMETYVNGDFYQGEFVNGLCEGSGTYLWKDGSEYNGDFKQGYRNGYGIWKNKHKDQVYQGHYMLDKKHGYGVYTWGNGYTYKGNYVEDERNGQGKLMYQDEVIYEGMWVNGQKKNEQSARHKKSFSGNKSHYSVLTKSTNMQHKKYHIRSPISQSKQNSTQKRIFHSTSKQKQKSLVHPSTRAPRQDTYCVTFKHQQEKKQRVGHRNCIPCQQLKEMREKNMSMKKEQNRSKERSASRK